MPRRDVDRLQAELEALFADLWQAPRVGRSRGFRPSVDSFRTDNPPELTVLVDLPGVDPASVSLVAGEQMLVVSGKRERPEGDRRVYQQMEIAYGPFARRIRLPEDVDPRRASAQFERGVLRVSMPAAEVPSTGRIRIVVETL